MPNPTPYSREQITAEQYFEETQLWKADINILAGRVRLLNQEHLISTLQETGRPTGEAERFAALLRETLAEWERHRRLIVERLAHLSARLGET
ncbi:hypothetical protein [Bradyrhizobium sp. STM 3557]|uniref:hypothetical protein n=1 Tax=Bradyrhizobium sp. STM 3557 TaxID=578920 RepID=UPI00388F84D2